MKLHPLDNAAEAEQNMGGVRRFLERARQLEPTDPEYTKGYFSVAVMCSRMHRSIEITNYTCGNWEVV